MALMFLLASCSQVVILQPSKVIEEDEPTVSFRNITPGEFSSVTSEVRVFGTTSDNTHFVTFFSEQSCSQLLGAGYAFGL